MSTWEIRVPHRGRDESLIDTASNARHLPEGERGPAREIVFAAMLDGLSTAGQLLDHLQAMDTHERRQLLDNARQQAGLESIADVEAGMRAEVASRAGEIIASQYDPQLCHGRTADGNFCNALPLNNGVPAATNTKKWFCEAHRGQARPGDLDPLPSPWRYSPSGAIVEVDPIELARDQTAAESRRVQQEAELAERATEAEAIREHQAAVDAQANRELPAHLRAAA